MSSENINSTSSDSEEVSLNELILKLREWYRYLKSKWFIILAFGILGALLGFTYAYFKKPVYSAATTFVLGEEDRAGGLGSLAGIASIAGLDLGSGGGGIFQGDNILQLYKSRNMIEKTLLSEVEYKGKSKLLIDFYIEFNRLRESWLANDKLKNITFLKGRSTATDPDHPFTRLQDSVMGTVVDDINKTYLKVEKPDKKLSIIKAEVTATNEFFAKAFNEQIVKNVNEFYIQTRTKKSLDNVLILQQKVDSVRTIMNGAIYSAAAVADATPNLNPTRQVQRIAPMQRSQFSAETNKTILGELVKNLELSKISLRKETPLIQVIDNPIMPLKKLQSGKLACSILGGCALIIMSVVFLIFKRIIRTLS